MDVIDMQGERRLWIDSKVPHLTGSVFLMFGETCIEFERDAFVSAIKREFGLVEPSSVGIDRLLEVA